jgi:hypothetical protein
MRKTMISIVLIAACGSERADAPAPTPSPQTSPTPAATPAPRIAGDIQLTEMSMPAMRMAMASAGASFYRLRDAAAAPDLEVPIGCESYSSDDPEDAGGTDEEEPAALDVGAITVQGGAFNLVLELRDGEYEGAIPEGTRDLFAAGAELIALGAGSDAAAMPEFEVAAIAPGQINVVIPTLDAGGLELSRDGSMRVEWRPGRGDFVQVALQAQSEEERRAALVVCNARDEGAMIVPAEQMALLPVGDLMFSVARVTQGRGVGAASLVTLTLVSTAMAMGAVVP